ncbi:transposase [Bacillus mangrovi]|uniref:Transposase n=2 Tax=Metabacillus mangrovi TaxID=1491830 RepID=A0A7X2S9N3_9BACI|nr:transposase [Metabacillus mangrovi]
MKRKNGPIEDVKKKYVRMALESGNTAFLARKLAVSPSTLSGWVRQYRDEVELEMKMEGVTPLSETSGTDEIQKKYDQAMKLLGEKELEVEMLREIIKKKSKP